MVVVSVREQNVAKSRSTLKHGPNDGVWIIAWVYDR
jgi:hypothetical protein